MSANSMVTPYSDTLTSDSSPSSSITSTTKLTSISPFLVEVDPYCPHRTTYHVYQEEGSNIYDAHLYQSETNLGQNNNKYYCIQLLESNVEPRSYLVFFRWCRIGEEGKNFSAGPISLLLAKVQFEQKFRDKTMNDWKTREKFFRYEGKYVWIEKDYPSTSSDGVKSSPPTLQDVIVRYLNREHLGSIRESTCRTIEEYLNRAARYHIVQAARGWHEGDEESVIPPVWLNSIAGADSEHSMLGRHSIRACYPTGISPFAGKTFIPLHSSTSIPTTIFPTTIIDQWYHDVSREITIPVELDRPLERVRLEIILQAILGIILPIKSHLRPVIGPRELWSSLDFNPRFFVYLGCRLDGCAVEPTSVTSLQDERRSSLVSYAIAEADFLPSEFVFESKAMAEMNKQCWYHNKEKVIQVARRIVNQQHTVGPMEEILRTYRIRPLQFHGRRIDSHTSSSSCRIATVTFGVTDSVGHEHRYHLDYAHRIQVGREASVLYNYDCHSTVAKIRTEFLPDRCHTIHLYTDLNDFAHELNDTQKTLIASPSPSPVFDTEPTVHSMPSTGSLSNSSAKMCAVLTQAFKVMNFSPIIEHAIFLTEFSRYGPSLYQNNHTTAVRRNFTSAIIDTAMESSELVLLPSAIVDLITDYATLDLPFIDSEATEQMSQYPLVATHSNYPRHNSNPVEAIQRPGPIESLCWDRARRCVRVVISRLSRQDTLIIESPMSTWIAPPELNETEDEHSNSHSPWNYMPPLLSRTDNSSAPPATFFLPPLSHQSAAGAVSNGLSVPFTFGVSTGQSESISANQANGFQLAPSTGGFSFGVPQSTSTINIPASSGLSFGSSVADPPITDASIATGR